MLPRNLRTDADIRKHQIDTLKIFNDNVTEIIPGSEYKVIFTAGGHEFTLKVYLTPDFPNDKPQITIQPLISHHWITPDGHVKNAPGLLKYTIHSDLGRVVQAIIRDFERTPPPLVSDVGALRTVDNFVDMEALNRISPQNYANSSQRFTYGSPPHGSVPLSPYTPMYFPDLKNLTNEELQILNDHPAKQDTFLDNLQQVGEVNKAVETLISQIEYLADSNLSKRQALGIKKTEVTNKLERVTALRSNCEALHQKYQSLADKYAPANIQRLLEVESQKKDHECEGIATNFLNGKISVDQFVQSYIKSRKLSQICKTKEEKLAHQLNELKRKGF